MAPHAAYLVVSSLASYAADDPPLRFALAAAHGNLPAAQLAVSRFGDSDFSAHVSRAPPYQRTVNGACRSLSEPAPDVFEKIPPTALLSFLRVQNQCFHFHVEGSDSWTAKTAGRSWRTRSS